MANNAEITIQRLVAVEDAQELVEFIEAGFAEEFADRGQPLLGVVEVPRVTAAYP